MKVVKIPLHPKQSIALEVVLESEEAVPLRAHLRRYRNVNSRAVRFPLIMSSELSWFWGSDTFFSCKGVLQPHEMDL